MAVCIEAKDFEKFKEEAAGEAEGRQEAYASAWLRFRASEGIYERAEAG